MRSSATMYKLILDIAQDNTHVRAVCQNGSRVNKNVEADKYQDYDIAYIVDDLNSVIKDMDWIDRFGNRIITQFPEAQELFPPQFDRKFPILMLFDDYNRIDLTLVDINKVKEYIQEDSLTKVLLDKDKVMPKINESNDSSHWMKRPTQNSVDECVNEFYWVSTYVMKGIWRNELLYAIDSLNIVRKMLLLMLSWREAFNYNFKVNFGKSYKYLTKYLSETDFSSLSYTFPQPYGKDIQQKLYNMISFFDEVYIDFCKKLNIKYQDSPYERVKEYIGYEDR